MTHQTVGGNAPAGMLAAASSCRRVCVVFCCLRPLFSTSRGGIFWNMLSLDVVDKIRARDPTRCFLFQQGTS